MHVLVTGAAGFVGAALVQRLLAEPTVLGEQLTRLTLIDRRLASPSSPLVHAIEGDFADAGVLDKALAVPVNTLFHLASVPGALAERDDALGWQVNLLGTLALWRRLARQVQDGGPPPKVIFASSVAVYGALGNAPIDEDATPHPTLSYGMHKWVAEGLLADLARRGELDGCSLRLPGIVARPPSESGHGSAFMSGLLNALAAGEAFECPVSPSATCWWMSVPACVDNLLHAARLTAPQQTASRCWQPPVLRLAVEELVEAAALAWGADRRQRVSYRPDERIEALFGRMPPLRTPLAEAAGFRSDATALDLLRRAIRGGRGEISV